MWVRRWGFGCSPGLGALDPPEQGPGAGLVSVVVVVGPPVGDAEERQQGGQWCGVGGGALWGCCGGCEKCCVAEGLGCIRGFGGIGDAGGGLRSCGLLGGSVDSVGSVVFSDGSVSLVRDAESSLAELVPAELVPAELVFVGSVLVESGLV